MLTTKDKKNIDTKNKIKEFILTKIEKSYIHIVSI